MAAGNCTAVKQEEYKRAQEDGSNSARDKCNSGIRLSLPTTVSPLPDSINVVDGGTDLKATYQVTEDDNTDTEADTGAGDEVDEEDVILVEDGNNSGESLIYSSIAV